MSLWTDNLLQDLFLKNTPLIDVRAPTEFIEGAIPNSINLPLLNDEERHSIGICYKTHGQSAALELGHQLVSGDIKNKRIEAWLNFIKANQGAEVFCFRGGLRSQISCEWINQKGMDQSPIPGGYKRLRQFFLSWLNEAPLPSFFRLGGLTGSGKTNLLQRLTHHVDIEGLANHRGSAFGTMGKQPAQITFENLLGLSLLKHQSRMIVEDESVTLGKLTIPLRFFKHMNESPLAILRCPQDNRITNIYEDYVLNQEAAFFLNATQSISKKLGGVRSAKLLEKISQSFQLEKKISNHQEWISTFLLEYYDPLYNKSLLRHKDLIVFEGHAEEIKHWWQNRK